MCRYFERGKWQIVYAGEITREEKGSRSDCVSKQSASGCNIAGGTSVVPNVKLGNEDERNRPKETGPRCHRDSADGSWIFLLFLAVFNFGFFMCAVSRGKCGAGHGARMGRQASTRLDQTLIRIARKSSSTWLLVVPANLQRGLWWSPSGMPARTCLDWTTTPSWRRVEIAYTHPVVSVVDGANDSDQTSGYPGLRMSGKPMRKMKNQAGASMLEFTFVGIPLIFVLISIFEISRGMWAFNTLSHSVKEGVRFAIVHGNNCVIPPNNCPVRTSDICTVMRNNGPGLEPARVINIKLNSNTREISYPTLTACLADNTVIFPSRNPGPTTDNGGAQGNPVGITATYVFDSALAFFWTGQSGFTFGRIYLPASANERIRY
jgi:hypothetical protein